MSLYAMTTKGLHFDEGKLRLDLVPPEAEEAIAWVLGYGCHKYAERNWELGMDWMKVYASVRRHLLEWIKCNDVDCESAILHIDHALCDLAMLVAYVHRRIGNDNRPRSNNADTDTSSAEAQEGQFGKATVEGGVVDGPQGPCPYLYGSSDYFKWLRGL